MTHSPAGPGHHIDQSLCGRMLFRGRYLFVKEPTCSVCRRIMDRLSTGLPAAPKEGEHTAHLYNQTQRSGGVADA